CSDGGWWLSNCPANDQHTRDPRKHWKVRLDNFTVEHRSGYYLDLDRCLSSAPILDRIFQIHGKAWATPEAMDALLDALTMLLNPQANFCPSGAGKVISERARLRQLIRRNRQMFLRRASGINLLPAN